MYMYHIISYSEIRKRNTVLNSYCTHAQVSFFFITLEPRNDGYNHL